METRLRGAQPREERLGLRVPQYLPTCRARSRHVALTDAALLRLPEAISTLFQGNRDALEGFTDAEAEQLVGLLIRLTINLDQLATVQIP